MRSVESLSAGVRYVLTDLGREALASAEVCSCKPSFSGTFLLCRGCHTVLGLLSQVALGGGPLNRKPGER